MAKRTRRSSAPLFLFAPGAGAGISHAWMRHWANLLGDLGAVHAFDYPYRLNGGSRPDPLPKLIAAHIEALRQIRLSHDGPVVLIGKSMGGRIGCHVALSESVSAVVCFGYPLCAAGDPSKLRDKVLRELATPILFIQGTRDRLCPLNLLQPIRSQMAAPNDLHIVEQGDHSLLVTKRWLKEHRKTQEGVDQEIHATIGRFLDFHMLIGTATSPHDAEPVAAREAPSAR
jgi:predicted alpha/beta-hydrolase family hydrolase